jgi:hypothetical protein
MSAIAVPPEAGAGSTMAGTFRYAAFLSYASKDAVFAKRLHAALEGYRIPASLGHFNLAGHANRVYPVFRDREELAAGSLGGELESARHPRSGAKTGRPVMWWLVISRVDRGRIAAGAICAAPKVGYRRYAIGLLAPAWHRTTEKTNERLVEVRGSATPMRCSQPCWKRPPETRLGPLERSAGQLRPTRLRS